MMKWIMLLKDGTMGDLGRNHNWSTFGYPHGSLVGDPQILVGDPPMRRVQWEIWEEIIIGVLLDTPHGSLVGDPHGRLVGDLQILVGDPQIFVGDPPMRRVSNSTILLMIFCY